MRLYQVVITAIILGMQHGAAFSWSIFGPKNYDECILDNMKDVKTDQAANAVAYACASKFPSDTKNQKPKKLRCNGEEVDPNEYSISEFDVPNKYGVLRIVRLAWEPLNSYSSETVFRVYIQHSYPYSIQGLYLQGFTSKNKEDATYWCSGRIEPNAVGSAVCQNVQRSSKTFSVSKVLTPNTNYYELLKSLKRCQ